MASGVEPYAASSAGRDVSGRRVLARVVGLADRNSFVVLAVATCAVVLLNRLPAMLGSDAWLMLVSAREVLEEGLPRHDTLTLWSQGEAWVDQQWAAQLVFYGVHALAGLKGLLLANVVVIVAAYAAGLGCARVLGASGRSVAFVGLAGIPVLVTETGARAQTLAYPLFVALLALLVSGARRGTSPRVLLVLPILVVWANVHDSVVLGAALVTLWAVAEAVRRLRGPTGVGWARIALLAVAPWACALASPYGLDLVEYYRSAIGDTVPSALPRQLPFLALAAVGTWIVARNRAVSAFEQAAFAVTAAAGLVSSRNVVWFVLLTLVVVPAALDALWPEPARAPRPRTNVLLTGVALGLVVFGFAAVATRDVRLYSGPYSEPAAQALGSAVAGNDKRVFANEQFADWLLWLYPDLAGRVAFDARLELLEPDELKAIDRWRARSGGNWRSPAKGFELLVLDLEREREVVLSLIRGGASPTYSNGRLVLLVPWDTGRS